MNKKQRASLAAAKGPRQRPIMAPPLPPPLPAAVEVAVTLVDADEGGVDDLIDDTPPAPPGGGRPKNVYNPHRVLHIVVGINFALVLLLGSLFGAYVFTRPAQVAPTVPQPQTGRGGGDGALHRMVYFSFASAEAAHAETLVQLPGADRLLDVSVCCMVVADEVTCTSNDISISVTTGVARIRPHPRHVGASDCRLSWTVQK